MAHNPAVVVALEGAPYTTSITTLTASAGGSAETAHALVADEPEALGGRDKGPGPFELLLASLGACKVITCRMYADRKRWPVGRITAALDYRRAGGPPTDNPARDAITCDMQFEPAEGHELTQDQLDRLLEISARCPVHRALDRGIDVRTVGSDG